MTELLLTRQPQRAAPRVQVAPAISFLTGRAHEICGAARHVLALWIAAQMQGPILWIRPQWAHDVINSDYVQSFMDPGRILYVAAPRETDTQWSIEEAMRSGAAPLMIAEMTKPPSLTAVRRMHLAAENAPGTPPLALLLTEGDGGAAGIETRWHMSPTHHDVPNSWRLERRRARALPPQAWAVTATCDTRNLRLCTQPIA